MTTVQWLGSRGAGEKLNLSRADDGMEKKKKSVDNSQPST